MSSYNSDQQTSSMKTSENVSRVTSITTIESAKEFLAITGGDNLTVVDFFTVWCGPCKRIAPVIEEMAQKNPNVNFCKIDAQHPDASMQKVVNACEINAYPTFCFFKSSKCVQKIEGANPAAIEQAIQELQ